MGDDRLAANAAAGDERAFEVLYDRHHRALLGFCRHMLRSREEAEDALQQTFLRAHRALGQHGPPRDLRPWLFTIARNCCRSLLAARRSESDVDEADAVTEGLGEQVQVRADLRELVADVERLPDDQRAALVLFELADLPHDEIAAVIGVRTAKVKALIHQARTTLIAERDARDTPCDVVQHELATARGAALRRGPLRRHLRGCPPCQAYRTAVTQQRRALALVLPVAPSLGLKAGVLGAVSAGGAGTAVVGGAGTAATVAGGVAAKGIAAKVVASALLVGGATGGGVALVDRPGDAARPAAAPGRAPAAAGAAPAALVTVPRVIARGPGGMGDMGGARGAGRAKRGSGAPAAADRLENRRAKARQDKRQANPKARERTAGPPSLRSAPGRTKAKSRPVRANAPKRTRPTRPASPPGAVRRPAPKVKPMRAAPPETAQPVPTVAPAVPELPAAEIVEKAPKPAPERLKD